MNIVHFNRKSLNRTDKITEIFWYLAAIILNENIKHIIDFACLLIIYFYSKSHLWRFFVINKTYFTLDDLSFYIFYIVIRHFAFHYNNNFRKYTHLQLWFMKHVITIEEKLAGNELWQWNLLCLETLSEYRFFFASLYHYIKTSSISSVNFRNKKSASSLLDKKKNLYFKSRTFLSSMQQLSEINMLNLSIEARLSIFY